MFQETFESEFTWLNGFMRNVRRFGYRTAAIDPAGKREWNYEQLNIEANRFANALKNDGVQKSDVPAQGWHVVLARRPEAKQQVAQQQVDYAGFSSASAWLTMFSTVKPNSANSFSAGADSPKVVMPTMAPSRPTYLYQ